MLTPEMSSGESEVLARVCKGSAWLNVHTVPRAVGGELTFMLLLARMVNVRRANPLVMAFR